MSDQLNIVIPMAGRGSRFRETGYTTPKPLIPIHGTEMIKLVIRNLTPRREHRFIFLCLDQHLRNFGMERALRSWAPGCVVQPVDRVTEGAACTVLLAEELIDSGHPLMIANCDQWVDVDIDTYLAVMDQAGADGLIMTMMASDPKWSFVRLSQEGYVTEVVEKVVVSNEATVGIYNFRSGASFVRGARSMIRQNLRVNGEFYVAPVYTELVNEGAKLVVHNVGKVGGGMYGLGTPEDLEQFLSLPVSKSAARR